MTCVLLNSVQSQANRMEEALQEALERKELQIPTIEVDFSKAELLDPVGRITSLQTPHRIADAILRDSNYDGQPFRRSAAGKELDFASATNATPLYRLCPTALLFGMWDSTGPKGGLGVKFERAMVSEVVGVGVLPTSGDKSRGLRRDPLNISKSVAIRRKGDGDWEVAGVTKEKGLERPSEINHSNVPFDTDNTGVTIEYAEQTTTLSLIALWRLRFPAIATEPSKAEVDDAARAVIAALGLCAATLAFQTGMDLRSCCLLWPEGSLSWELLERPGSEPTKFPLDRASCIELLNDANAAAEKAGIQWQKEPLILEPKPELVKLVRLETIEKLLASTKAENLRAALFRQWRYEDERLSMRWDPEDAREHAYQWTAPANDVLLTVWGANLLAAEGSTFFPVMPQQSSAGTTGFRDRGSRAVLTWPTWRGALTADSCRSLLSLAELSSTEPDRGRLRERGIVAVFRCRKLKMGEGKNFKWAFSPSQML